VGLATGQDRPVLELRSEARHRIGEIVRGERQAHAGHLERGAGVDGDDPRPGAVEAHQLHVQRILEPDVGHVRLSAGDAVDAADPGGRRADARAVHRGVSPASAAARTASMICP
jgi:hypothetical protein